MAAKSRGGIACMIMRACSTLLAFVCCALSQAQDWDLFPLGQRAYYRDISSADVQKVSMQLMDSVRMTGQDEVQYFRRRLPVTGLPTCSAEALQIPMYWEQDPYAMDSLVERNDSVFYRYFGVTSPFYFLPKASIGQSWTITSTYSSNTYDQITITCTDIIQETFLGITDSVKTFSMAANGSSTGQTPVSNFTMRLSKAHGLLEFVPFQLFLVHPAYIHFRTLRMIGLDETGIAHGFQQPLFEDYFHPLAGDLLYWEDIQIPVFLNDPIRIYHRLDSITDVITTADSIVVTYDRHLQQPDLSVTFLPDQTNVIKRSGFSDLLSTPPNWRGAGNNEYCLGQAPNSTTLWASGSLMLRIDDIANDTIVEYEFLTSPHFIYPASCIFYEVSDSGNDFKLDTRAGAVHYCAYYNSPGSFCSTLLGARIGGEQQGTIIALSVNDLAPERSTELTLYPDPVSDRIFIRDLRSPAGLRYEIRDITGVLIAQAPIDMEGIPVDDLAPGQYIVRLISIEGVTTGRFVKE